MTNSLINLVITAGWTILLVLTTPVIAIPMIAIGWAFRRFNSIVIGAVTAAIAATAYTALKIGAPSGSEISTEIVAFAMRFVAAMIWGAISWWLAKLIRKRRAEQDTDQFT